MEPKSKTRLALALALLAVALVASACASKPRAVAPPPAPEPPVVTQPATLPEEEVQPETATIPSEEVMEELPADLQELNRRGYLKDVFFDTDKYDLRPEARELLAANAAWLQQYRGVTVTVEGHCDERNTREYNLALGERRANATRDYLVKLGIPAERLRAVSYGEEKPFAQGHDESAWRLNRRAHFLITGR